MKQKITLARRLRYEFDKSMSAGPIAVIGWLAVISLIGIFGAGLVLWLARIAPDGSKPFTFAEATWQALMRTIDSGDVENDQGWAFRGVSILVTLWGIFIVSSLIGLLGAGVQERIGQLRKGRSTILERDHTLILNWSTAVFDIIQQISVAAAETKTRRVLVVMAQKEKVEMEDAIAEKMPTRSHVRVICRSGDPTSLRDLAMANVNAAKAVIVVSPDDGNPDARNLKTVLALTQASGDRKPPRQVVAEFRDSANVEAVHAIGGQAVQAVMADDLISRIIVHSSRQSGLSAVYSDLLAYEGMEFYIAPAGLAGRTFGEALVAFEDGALVGLSSNGKVRLNPPMDTRIEEGVSGVFVAYTLNAIRLAKKKPLIYADAILAERHVPQHAERALILGWNRRGPAVASELSCYMTDNSVMTIVADTPGFAEAIASVSLENKNVRLEHAVADCSNRAVIRGLNPAIYNHVIVLSCSDGLDHETADTRTLMSLVHLRHALSDAGGNTTLVSEILDVHNQPLAEAVRADDFVVSNRLVSLMLTQMSDNESLLPIFTEILDEDGAEIYMRPVEDYVKTGANINFCTIVSAAAARGECAFGYFKRADGRVKLNPVKSAPVVFAAGDSVIVMAHG